MRSTPFRSSFAAAALCIISAATLPVTPIAPNSTSRTRVAFGSCSRAEKEQPLWDHIVAYDPDVFIWGGDAVYSDIRHPCIGTSIEDPFDRSWDEWKRCFGRAKSWLLGGAQRPAWSIANNTKFTPARPDRLRRIYDAQARHPGYRSLLRALRSHDEANATPSRVVGTWDDHDYGIDDGDSRYAFRKASRFAFARFMAAGSRIDEEGPRDMSWLTPRDESETTQWLQPTQRESHEASEYGEDGAGVYRYHLVGTPPRQLMLLLLDLRYFKEPWTTVRGNLTAMLGKKQILWLNRTLHASQAQVHFIVSSLQVLPTQRNIASAAENWERMGKAREELLSLILSTGAPSPLLLSGDVHFAELSKQTCRPSANGGKSDAGAESRPKSSGKMYSALSRSDRMTLNAARRSFFYTEYSRSAHERTERERNIRQRSRIQIRQRIAASRAHSASSTSSMGLGRGEIFECYSYSSKIAFLSLTFVCLLQLCA